MKIFSIADLHFATKVHKPMDIFGAKWENHEEKIKEAWHKVVKNEDIVLISGDISWAMMLEEALPDLAFLSALPGKKICIKGNHDYWWSKINKLNTLYENIFFLQNKAYVIDDLAICGTRGWLCPTTQAVQEGDKTGNRIWTKQDEKIYKREAVRLELSLKDAMKQKVDKIIVMLHYPPTNEQQEASLFTQILQAYPVSDVVYGHLHDTYSQEKALKGHQGSQHYHLVSADYLQFMPKQISMLALNA